MSSSAARYFPRIFEKWVAPNQTDAQNPQTSFTQIASESLREPSSTAATASAATDIVDSSAAPSDEALMARICEGDREALGLLFHRYARIVRGVAYRVLRDASEADDLLQDIFLLIHRLCRTFDRSKGPARFWILQMTHRRAISRRRYLTSRHFYTRLDIDQAVPQLRDPMTKSTRYADSIGEALEKAETLRSWFDQLSQNQRETLRLFFFEGYTFEEIAAKLGQTTVNARNHYYRGLDKLRKQIFAGKLPRGEALW